MLWFILFSIFCSYYRWFGQIKILKCIFYRLTFKLDWPHDIDFSTIIMWYIVPSFVPPAFLKMFLGYMLKIYINQSNQNNLFDWFNFLYSLGLCKKPMTYPLQILLPFPWSNVGPIHNDNLISKTNRQLSVLQPAYRWVMIFVQKADLVL